MTKQSINDKLFKYNDYNAQKGVFMKKILKILLLAAIMAVSAIGLVACGEGGGKDGETGLLYKQYQGDSYYTVYGYTDDGTGKDTLDISEYNVNGVSIGRIKKNAFKDNDTIKTLIIPSSVETIDEGAFANMKKLETIELPFIGATPVADTSFNSIDEAENKSVGEERLFGYVFGTEEYTGGLAITQNYDDTNAAATHYIPATLKKVIVNNPSADKAYNVPMYAFYGVNLISEVELKGNIGIIGECAFKNALGLTKVNVPASVSKICKEAFMGTVNLKNGFSFDDSENANVSFIGESAFNGSAIASIVLPASVTEIGESCFANSKISAITLSANITKIPTGTFANCKYLTSLSIPASVTKIRARAFMGCDALSSVQTIWEWKNGDVTKISSDDTVEEVATKLKDTCLNLDLVKA